MSDSARGMSGGLRSAAQALVTHGRAMAFLELVRQGASATRFAIDRDRAVIGRNSDCDVPLDVAAVSRRHAAIVRERDDFFVEDLESRNGTFLNDERVVNRAPLRRRRPALDLRPDVPLPRRSHAPAATLASDTSLLDLMDDDTTEAGRASVMATFDVGGGGSASWRLSAKPEVKLAALLEITNNLGKALSVEEILPKLLDSLFKIFVQADRGFVVMRPKPDGPLVPVAVKNRREGDEQRTRISRTIVEEAMKSRKAILSADASSDERFSMAQSIADFAIRSMICAPMIGSDGEPLGVIQIDTMNQRSRFTDEDLEVLAGVASQAAMSLDNAKMHEQVLAQRAMRARPGTRAADAAGAAAVEAAAGARLLSSSITTSRPGRSAATTTTTSSCPDGRFAVIVGDVAGKGVSAALLMARLSSDVRFLLASEADPAKAVEKINAGFSQQRLAGQIRDDDRRRGQSEDARADARERRPHGPAACAAATAVVEAIGEETAGLPLGVAADYRLRSRAPHSSSPAIS